ncbi:hypothetical protein DFH07DRAFT_340597 [Mycena maculata]|uniref:Uncharacterized protein n=1 Tax=Mycena maculata TaxID=230809 RepID=A0AAD7MHF6_9AGAR|nr:hypothetical protein DFH07DRAFT_340597 [Mycena maculata]
MLARLVRDLIPAAKCSVSLSNALKSLCHPLAVAPGASRVDLGTVYSGLVAPCLTARTSILVSEAAPNDSFWTVSVKFHDHSNLVIPDYFTGLGYLLSLQAYGPLSLLERIRLLAMYAKVCKLSSPLVQSRPPTTVQLLWVNSPHVTDTRIVLGSSLAWLKVRNHFQMARAVREQILRDLWRDALVDPTPMQVCFPNPVGALFGSCWGDCAEAISLSAFWELVASGTPLGTLALNVAAMNAVDLLTGLSACDVILAGNLSLQETLGVLVRANAFRPMCKNCEHLCDRVAADIVDCACAEFWLKRGLFSAPGPQTVLARA